MLTRATTSPPQILIRALLCDAVGVCVLLRATSCLDLRVVGVAVAHTALRPRWSSELLCGGQIARRSGGQVLVVTAVAEVACGPGRRREIALVRADEVSLPVVQVVVRCRSLVESLRRGHVKAFSASDGQHKLAAGCQMLVNAASGPVAVGGVREVLSQVLCRRRPAHPRGQASRRSRSAHEAAIPLGGRANNG